jgi:methanogenic corrinoid protein MtbC1
MAIRMSLQRFFQSRQTLAVANVAFEVAKKRIGICPQQVYCVKSDCDEAFTFGAHSLAIYSGAKGHPMSDDDEIILSELDDDELVQQMHDDLYDGLKEEIEEAVNILLERGWTPYNILTKALVEGMRIVGIDFRDGILFVPEVLLAANAMKAGMAILRPLLVETGAPKLGTMVIGTVKGDIHDIGKNLVSMMMEGAGFDVHDIGINTDVDEYLAALEEHKPDILGMSALLTTTMPYMKVVIDTMQAKGIRDDYVILVGGAPLNEEFGKAIGADAYCRDAAVAVETAKDFMSRKHNQMAAG